MPAHQEDRTIQENKVKTLMLLPLCMNADFGANSSPLACLSHPPSRIPEMAFPPQKFLGDPNHSRDGHTHPPYDLLRDNPAPRDALRGHRLDECTLSRRKPMIRGCA